MKDDEGPARNKDSEHDSGAAEDSEEKESIRGITRADQTVGSTNNQASGNDKTLEVGVMVDENDKPGRSKAANNVGEEDKDGGMGSDIILRKPAKLQEDDHLHTTPEAFGELEGQLQEELLRCPHKYRYQHRQPRLERNRQNYDNRRGKT